LGNKSGFLGDGGTPAKNYVEAGKGFDPIEMPTGQPTGDSKYRFGTPLRTTEEYPDQPTSASGPGGPGSSDNAFRRLKRAVGLPFPSWQDDGDGGGGAMKDFTDKRYR
jgi:hypothetical protein